MAERKAWWEILRDQFASRGLLDPESERVQETVRAAPAAQRQARGLLSLDQQAESDTALEMGLGALPGVAQAMALRDLERARRAKDPGAAAMAASNFLPVDRLIGALRYGLGKPPIAQALEAASTVSKKVTQKSLERQLKAVDPNASLVKTVVFDGQGNRKPMYVARVNNKSVEIGSHLDDVEAWAQESLESLANQRKAASINAELGLPETAQTGLWVVQGVDPQGNPFNMERAKKAAEKIRFRHEQTNYDDMLQQGISKEEARGDVTAMFNRLKASK